MSPAKKKFSLSPGQGIGLSILAAAAVAALLVGGVLWWQLKHEPALPELMEAPSWALTNQRGEPVTSDDLSGQVYVVAFVFLECRGICPQMLGSLKQLHDEIAASPYVGELRLLPMSIDGTNDTPENCTAYMERMELSDEVVTFLTGPEDEVWPISEDGFALKVMLNTAEDPEVVALSPIVHADQFVLIDGQGRVRGMYPATEPKFMPMLLADAEQLILEARQ